MSGNEPSVGGQTKRGLGRGLTLAIAAAVVVGAAGALYVIAGSSFKPGGVAGIAGTGAMKKLVAVSAVPPPAQGFVDANGKPVHIADFKGQVVLVNLWATWCGPCVKEMPTLAALQQAYAGKPVKVVAVSVDSAEATDKAKAFIAKHAPLDFYQNADLKLPFAFQPPAQEFPTTVIYGKDGLQRARMTGDADWSSPEAHAVVDKLLAAGS
jgi:thiol-disulfide isomerase/thioredoxin